MADLISMCLHPCPFCRPSARSLLVALQQVGRVYPRAIPTVAVDKASAGTSSMGTVSRLQLERDLPRGNSICANESMPKQGHGQLLCQAQCIEIIIS